MGASAETGTSRHSPAGPRGSGGRASTPPSALPHPAATRDLAACPAAGLPERRPRIIPFPEGKCLNPQGLEAALTLGNLNLGPLPHLGKTAAGCVRAAWSRAFLEPKVLSTWVHCRCLSATQWERTCPRGRRDTDFPEEPDQAVCGHVRGVADGHGGRAALRARLQQQRGKPAGGARAEEAVGGWGSSPGSPPPHFCAHGFSAPHVPQGAFPLGRPSLQSLAVHTSTETGCSLTQFWSLKPRWTLHPRHPTHTLRPPRPFQMDLPPRT